MLKKVTGTANIDFMEVHDLLNENNNLLEENNSLREQIDNLIKGSSEIIKALWKNGVSTNVQDLDNQKRIINALGHDLLDGNNLVNMVSSLTDTETLFQKLSILNPKTS